MSKDFIASKHFQQNTFSEIVTLQDTLVIKTSITKNGTNQYQVLLDMMHWKKITSFLS